MRPHRFRTLKALSFFLFVCIPSSASAGLLDYLGDKAADALKDYLSAKGIQLSWKNFESQKTGEGILTQNWSFSAEDTCVETQETLKKACFKSISTKIQWSAKFGLPEISVLGPIHMTGGHVILDGSSPSSKKKSDSKAPGDPIREIDLSLAKLPEIFSKTVFKSATIDIPDLVWVDPKAGDLKGHLRIDMKPVKKKLGDIEILGELKDQQSQRTFALSGTLESKSHFQSGDVQANLRLRFDLPGTASGKIHLNASIPSDQKQAKIALTADTQTSQGDLHLQADVVAEKKRISADFSATAHPTLADIQEVQIKNCHAQLLNDLTTINCPLQIDFGESAMQRHQDLNLELPKTLHAKVTSRIEHQGILPQPSQFWKTSFHASIDRIENSWMTFYGVLDATTKGRVNELEAMQVGLNGDLHLDIKHFQFLVSALGNGDYGVPAPLRMLDGRIFLKIKPILPFGGDILKISLSIESNLKSELQSLQFTTRGTSELKLNHGKPESLQNIVNVDIKKIRIALPPMNPYPIPRFALDGRFVRREPLTEETKVIDEKSFSIANDISLKTKAENGIEILSKYTKEPLPISLDVRLKPSEELEGWVNVGSTPLDLFRRDARVDSFKVEFKEPIDDSPIDGLVSVHYVDYKILIKLKGTLAKPTVHMESVPPLPENEILSVLIYGEPLSSLDSTDSGSVGKLSAAMADRAVTLASLYLFASTPIQRVGYNPETGKVSASVKLTEGTSLVVGSGHEGQEAGIRKRLGYGWYLTSLLHTASGDESSRVSALLEWLRRF